MFEFIPRNSDTLPAFFNKILVDDLLKFSNPLCAAIFKKEEDEILSSVVETRLDHVQIWERRGLSFGAVAPTSA